MRLLIWIGALTPIFYALIRFSVNFHPAWLRDIFVFAEQYVHMTLTRFPADPLKFMTDLSGNSALWMLAITLSISPLRTYLKLTLLEYRRLLGLFAFFYALIHMVLFVAIDQGFNIPSIIHQITTKPFIAFGMGAFSILLLMTLTSGKRTFGKFKGWHKLVYLAVVLITIHYLMSHKTVSINHIIVVGTLFMLLALRLIKR